MEKSLQKEKRSRSVRIIIFIYTLALIGMLSLIVVINFTKEKPVNYNTQETYQNITAFWTLDKEGTKPVDVRLLGDYMDPESGVMSIYYRIPELSVDTSFLYRSKDVYTRVLVGEDVLYETSVYDSPLYNESPGNLWNIVGVSSDYSGQLLEIEITMVYDTDAITVDSLYLGDKADVMLGLFSKHKVGILTSFLLLLLGIVLVVMDFMPTYVHVKKRYGLWWVGFYAFMMGYWSFIETNVAQFFADDMRILQLIDNMLMMFSTLPLVMYVDVRLGILKNRLMRVFCFLTALYGVVCVAVQYSGVTDMHSMLAPSSIFMLTTDIGMCVWLISKTIKVRKDRQALLDCALITFGILFRSTCSVIETISTLQMDKLDRAELIRFGMLVLCICFAIAGQLDTYRIIGQGMKYELISHLAYSDGLTGLGNRTAYLEELDTYKNGDKRFSKLGIIYLDVNDLKQLNDSKGHEYGDRLLQTAAKIISDSFGTYGNAYRVGGDEFCVLMSGIVIEENYKSAVAVFEKLIDEANKEEKEFTVRIAHGFAFCEDALENRMEEAIAKADKEMYRNKEELKGMA